MERDDRIGGNQAGVGDWCRCAMLVERLGLAGGVRAVEPITGGISSDVFRVDLGPRVLCLKFPCEQLRVPQPWHAPLERSTAEYNWLAFAASVEPCCVPTLFGHDPVSHGFAMAYLPGDRFANWKGDLLAGRVDPAVAARAGAAIVAIHAQSAGDADRLASRFPNRYFKQLRIDPYFGSAAQIHPAAAAEFAALSRMLLQARIALMHGDVSPKNILVGRGGPVFLDAEPAAFGDPAFDAAFCLTHLIAKSFHLPASRMALRAAAEAFARAYLAGVDWEAPAALDARVARLIAALMLARVAGKSRLDYLDGPTADRIAAAALALMRAPPPSIIALLDRLGTER